MESQKPVKVAGSVYWVGALNPDLRRFDVVMHTEYGTSYNAYLVMGKSKTALIETVKDSYFDEHISRIREVIDPQKIDYIVMNHTEPDHSGSLPAMLEACPNATVVCSRSAATLLKDIVNADFGARVVKDGDSIDLGGASLNFISAPFLHWPDTMLTFVPEERILFTCDVFGCHYSAEKVLESAVGDEYLGAQKYYFDVIMGPFKKYVRDALGKIAPLVFDVIAPSHGPVLDKSPSETVRRYAEWSEPEEQLSSVFIGYVSCYGYTLKLASEIRRALSDNGVESELCDLGLEDAGALADRAARSKGIIIGSPTLNRDALPPVWDVLLALSPIALQGKRAAAFGSYGWSGEAPKMVANRLESIGCKVLEPLRTRMRPNEAELKQAYELGREFAKLL